MNEAATEQPEPSRENENPGQRKTMAESEGLFYDLERFSRLSSDLKKCLSDVDRRIKNSMDELSAVEQEVVQKKAELKEIYDVEASAAVLENLIEEHRSQKQEFEKFIESQRCLWEEEKAKKEQEEEEYRRKWSEEQLVIRRDLEEELRVIQQQSIEKHKLMESDLLKRGQDLKKKELEWGKLIQELELFMTRLVARTRKGHIGIGSVDVDLQKNTSPVEASTLSNSSLSCGNFSDEKKMSEIEGESDASANPSIESIREMLLSQGRRIESIHTNLKENREPVPFSVPPPKTN